MIGYLRAAGSLSVVKFDDAGKLRHLDIYLQHELNLGTATGAPAPSSAQGR